MTTKTADRSHWIGVTLQFLSPFVVLGRAFRRGDTVTLTAENVEDSLDRFGSSWLDDLETEESQTARWGHPIAVIGEPDNEMRAWIFGDSLWEVLRKDALTQADKVAEPSARKRAFDDVYREFGREAPSRDWIAYAPDSDAASRSKWSQ